MLVLVSVPAVTAALTCAVPAPAGAAPQHGSPALPRFTEQLPVPPVLDRRAGGVVALDEVDGLHRFAAALPSTPTFGYVPTTDPATPEGSDAYLGPTIEAGRGHPLTVVVRNRLTSHPLAAFVDTSLEGVSPLDAAAPRTSLHLHGGHVPAVSDGGPVATFRRAGVDPGDSGHGTGAVTYRYPNDQEAAGLWYHDHALGITRLNVLAGLAGGYLLRDQYDTGRAGNPLGLPSGRYELPLIVQDRSFHPDGTLAYPLGPFTGVDRPDYPDQWAPEYFGDVATVNGKAWPDLDVDRAVYRFRVYNGSNARVYRFALRGPAGDPVRARLWQIGTDGGLLDAPVALDHLLLAPGERADLLVDLRGLHRGQRVRLTNDAPAPYPDAPTAPGLGGAPLREVLQLTSTGRAAATDQPDGVPSRLRGGPGEPAPLALPTPTRARTVELNEVLDPATGDPTEVLLNNLGFHQHTPGGLAIPRTTSLEQPVLDTVEEWDVVNTTVDAHPIHLHLVQFRVLDRQPVDAAAYLRALDPGLPAPSASDTGPWPPPAATGFLAGPAVGPSPGEQGWKDTVLAPPGTVTRVLVPFGGTAAGLTAAYTGDPPGAGTQRFTGEYVWHCHILEHEDNDMMLPYRVVLPG
ncbi:MAG: multicopper oxidase family protein [Mycobacteriales bacterium]